ncbi:MAG TPA: hypothetical protein VFT66_02695 [Roseiflexaceae bacterium]|jgi:hypothetical protein|nr:hypothetical protein [Roseiflexaceae bacterium]
MMKLAPKQIGGAEVICFAIIDSRTYPTDKCKHVVGGVLQGPASGLAICQYEGESSFYLFGCDQNWQSITDTWHETFEDAKNQAEIEYTGVSKAWQQIS